MSNEVFVTFSFQTEQVIHAGPNFAASAAAAEMDVSQGHQNPLCLVETWLGSVLKGRIRIGFRPDDQEVTSEPVSPGLTSGLEWFATEEDQRLEQTADMMEGMRSLLNPQYLD